MPYPNAGMYPLIPYLAKRSTHGPEQQAPSLPPPALADQIAEFGERPGPFTSFGEFSLAPVEPPPVPAPAFSIPPVDWAEEERERRERDSGEFEPVKPPGSAVAELMAEQWDPAPLLPPLKEWTPLRRPSFEPPDWRQEQLEAARRDERALDEERSSRYPPPKRGQA